MAATQYFCRVLKIATATVGSEPTYAIVVGDTKPPFIKVDTKAITVETAAGKKSLGYTATFEVTCYDAVGMATVDALVGTNVWLHAEPDGTIGATNPALQVKDFLLLKESSITGSISTPSEVRYFGEKTVLNESDAFAKDITP